MPPSTQRSVTLMCWSLLQLGALEASSYVGFCAIVLEPEISVQRAESWTRAISIT